MQLRHIVLYSILFIGTIAFAQGTFSEKLAAASVELTQHKVTYDPSYHRIPYPGGDVPPDRGVCTDVVIRAYRKVGIDLQKEVHEDMRMNFSEYPRNWDLSHPDPNIDHRRVPNLMVFFQRKGTVLPITDDPSHYKAGDIVCWNLGGAVTHIGLVIERRSEDGLRPLIVHNIGSGQVIEDVLFSYTIIGHFRYGSDQ